MTITSWPNSSPTRNLPPTIWPHQREPGGAIPSHPLLWGFRPLWFIWTFPMRCAVNLSNPHSQDHPGTHSSRTCSLSSQVQGKPRALLTGPSISSPITYSSPQPPRWRAGFECHSSTSPDKWPHFSGPHYFHLKTGALKAPPWRVKWFISRRPTAE